MQPQIQTYNNNKAPAFGKLDIDDSVSLPYLAQRNAKPGKVIERYKRHILRKFEQAKGIFKAEIKKLDDNQIDIFIKGVDSSDGFGSSGIISFIEDNKTGMTHVFGQQYNLYDTSLFAPIMRPKPYTVMQRTVETALDILKYRK